MANSIILQHHTQPYDFVFKILLLGDSGVGKSTLLKQYIDHEFNNSYMTTIGIDYACKYFKLNNKAIKLAIWDTAGQERFRSITKAYFRGIQGVIIIYDVCDVESFEHIIYWLNLIHEYADDQHIKYFLIGNKCDLLNNRKISYEQGRKLADQYSCQFFETSAKYYNNIADAFYIVAEDLIKDSANFKKDEIVPRPADNGKKRCC